jgi:hypothetical protein
VGRASTWRRGIDPHLDSGERRITYCHYLVRGQFHTLFLTDRCLYWSEMDARGRYTGRFGGALLEHIDRIGPVKGRPGVLLVVREEPGTDTEPMVLECHARQAASALTMHSWMLEELEYLLGHPAFTEFEEVMEDTDTDTEPTPTASQEETRAGAVQELIDKREANHARLLELRRKYGRE